MTVVAPTQLAMGPGFSQESPCPCRARLLHRATAMGLMLAYELTREEKHPWRGKSYFVSTSAQARRLYAQLREPSGHLDAS